MLRRLDLHSLHRLAVLARTFPIYRTLCSVSTICSSLPPGPHQLAVGGSSLHCEALQTGPGEPPDSIAPAQNINDRPAMPAPLRRTRDLLPGLAVDCSLRNFLQGPEAACRLFQPCELCFRTWSKRLGVLRSWGGLNGHRKPHCLVFNFLRVA